MSKPKLSLLVGLKNNIEYTRNFYQTTRDLYPEVEIVFVSYGSTDSTHAWLDALEDPNVVYHWSGENKTFSDTFNKAAAIATGEFVVYLHNDIVLAPFFLEDLEVCAEMYPNDVISYTTVEPPIFAGHERPGKIIRDFGTDIESFNKVPFYEFVDDHITEYWVKSPNREKTSRKDLMSEGATFFLMVKRKTLLEMGGLDNLYNPMFCEDDDLLHRFKLKGLKLQTSNIALCYHFVSKTSRFSEEFEKRTQEIEINSNKNYIRKWKQKGADRRYKTHFVINGEIPYAYLEALEPLADVISIKDTKDNNLTIQNYIINEQPFTKFDLISKFKFDDCTEVNELIVYITLEQFSNEDYQILCSLPQIASDLEKSGDTGLFGLGNLQVLTQKPLESVHYEYIDTHCFYYQIQLMGED